MHNDLEQHQAIVRHLRSLPQEIRQPYDWAEFRHRARERTDVAAREAATNRRYLALAAAVVLLAVGIATWVHLTPTSELASIGPEALSESNTQLMADNVDARADFAERWLAALPSDPVVVRVGTRAAVAGLEDRIAQLDDLLSAARVEGAQPARLAPLEQQRARLVNSLVQVRYAETLASESR